MPSWRMSTIPFGRDVLALGRGVDDCLRSTVNLPYDPDKFKEFLRNRNFRNIVTIFHFCRTTKWKWLNTAHLKSLIILVPISCRNLPFFIPLQMVTIIQGGPDQEDHTPIWPVHPTPWLSFYNFLVLVYFCLIKRYKKTNRIKQTNNIIICTSRSMH